MKKNVISFLIVMVLICFVGCEGCIPKPKPLLSCSNGLTAHFDMPRTKTNGVDWDFDKTAPDAYGRLVITQTDGTEHSESIKQRDDLWSFKVNLYKGKQVTINHGTKIKLVLDDSDIDGNDTLMRKTWKADSLVFKASGLELRLACRGQ